MNDTIVQKSCYITLVLFMLFFFTPSFFPSFQALRFAVPLSITTYAAEDTHVFGPFNFSLEESGQTQLQLTITLALRDDPYHLPDEKEARKQYGVERIHIHQEGHLLQTLEYVGGWGQNLRPQVLSNQSPLADFGITLVDCNFDGYADIKIYIMPNARNPYHYYFLFSPEEWQFERFDALSDLWNPEFHQRQRMIIEQRGGGDGGKPYTRIYSIFEGKQLREVKKISAYVVREKSHHVVVRHDWINEAWRETYRKIIESDDVDQVYKFGIECGDALRGDVCDDLP